MYLLAHLRLQPLDHLIGNKRWHDGIICALQNAHRAAHLREPHSTHQVGQNMASNLLQQHVKRNRHHRQVENLFPGRWQLIRGAEPHCHCYPSPFGKLAAMRLLASCHSQSLHVLVVVLEGGHLRIPGGGVQQAVVQRLIKEARAHPTALLALAGFTGIFKAGTRRQVAPTQLQVLRHLMHGATLLCAPSEQGESILSVREVTLLHAGW